MPEGLGDVNGDLIIIRCPIHYQGTTSTFLIFFQRWSEALFYLCSLILFVSSMLLTSPWHPHLERHL